MVNEAIGTFTDWRMRLWGESIDPSKAQIFPMPTEFDDLHDEDDDQLATAPNVATTSISVFPSTTLMPHPTDHIDRPVNSKPADDGIVVTSTGAVSSATAATSAALNTATSTESPNSDSSLPSYFPKLPGVSERTQIWIYGAIAVILVFCIALGIYCCVWRRRRTRSKLGDYEFEMVNDDDVDGAGEPLNSDGRRRRRGGELYDAFAGESDEEIFSDAEEEEYKDDPDNEKAKTRDTSPPELSEKS